MHKGIFIETSGNITLKELGTDKRIGIDVLQEAVGGVFDVCYPQELPEDYHFYCHDEGLLIPLPNNLLASLLYGGTIAGDILILKDQYSPYGRNSEGLEKSDFDKLIPLLKSVIGDFYKAYKNHLTEEGFAIVETMNNCLDRIEKEVQDEPANINS